MGLKISNSIKIKADKEYAKCAHLNNKYLKIKYNSLICFLKLQNKYSKLSVRDGMAATFSRTNNLYQQNNGKCDKGYKKNGPLVFLAQGGKEGKEKN